VAAQGGRIFSTEAPNLDQQTMVENDMTSKHFHHRFDLLHGSPCHYLRDQSKSSVTFNFSSLLDVLMIGALIQTFHFCANKHSLQPIIFVHARCLLMPVWCTFFVIFRYVWTVLDFIDGTFLSSELTVNPKSVWRGLSR